MICGAGPVGLFAEIILASGGVQVTILEALPEISDSPRAEAYQPPVLAEFMETDVYDALQAVAGEWTGSAYWSGDGPRNERLAAIPAAIRGVSEAFLQVSIVVNQHQRRSFSLSSRHILTLECCSTPRSLKVLINLLMVP